MSACTWCRPMRAGFQILVRHLDPLRFDVDRRPTGREGRRRGREATRSGCPARRQRRQQRVVRGRVVPVPLPLRGSSRRNVRSVRLGCQSHVDAPQVATASGARRRPRHRPEAVCTITRESAGASAPGWTSRAGGYPCLGRYASRARPSSRANPIRSPTLGSGPTRSREPDRPRQLPGGAEGRWGAVAAIARRPRRRGSSQRSRRQPRGRPPAKVVAHDAQTRVPRSSAAPARRSGRTHAHRVEAGDVHTRDGEQERHGCEEHTQRLTGVSNRLDCSGESRNPRTAAAATGTRRGGVLPKPRAPSVARTVAPVRQPSDDVEEGDLRSRTGSGVWRAAARGMSGRDAAALRRKKSGGMTRRSWRAVHQSDHPAQDIFAEATLPYCG